MSITRLSSLLQPDDEGQDPIDDAEEGEGSDSDSNYSAEEEDSDDDSPARRDQPNEASGFAVFPCLESSCIKFYRTLAGRDAHIAIGCHVFAPQHRPLLDHALCGYKEKLESTAFQPLLQLPSLSSTSAASSSSATTTASATVRRLPVAEGWAQPEARKRQPFSTDQRLYLTKKFSEGEESGQKWTAEAVEKVCADLLQVFSPWFGKFRTRERNVFRRK